MTAPEGAPLESGRAWQYVGIGCITLSGGLFGGGMLGVMAAKIYGAARHCVADANTGAPCDWGKFWLIGALAGGVLLPAIVFFKLRRGRLAAAKSDRG